MDGGMKQLEKVIFNDGTGISGRPTRRVLGLAANVGGGQYCNYVGYPDMGVMYCVVLIRWK
jgi:hypothetical protein